MTPLHLASVVGHLTLTQWLVREAAADTSTRDQDGRTALRAAVFGDHFRIVQFLIKEGGADPNTQCIAF